MFDHIFQIHSSGFYASLKYAWPSDFDVSFEEAKGFIALDNSHPLPSQLGPKNLPFETRVIAHIVATTLLPRVSSLSSLAQRDTLLTYCLVSRRKIKLSSFVINYMIEVASNPFSLPYGMVISRILEANNISLVDIPPRIVKQCYNSKAFISMGYVRTKDSWVLKSKTDVPVVAPSSKVKAPSSSIPSDFHADILANLVAMNKKVESFNDKLISIQFQMEKIKDVTKETSSAVARIRIKLDRVIKEAIKVVTNIQASGEGIAVSLATKFDNLKEAVAVNTICYLFRK